MCFLFKGGIITGTRQKHQVTDISVLFHLKYLYLNSIMDLKQARTHTKLSMTVSKTNTKVLFASLVRKTHLNLDLLSESTNFYIIVYFFLNSSFKCLFNLINIQYNIILMMLKIINLNYRIKKKRGVSESNIERNVI